MQKQDRPKMINSNKNLFCVVFDKPFLDSGQEKIKFKKEILINLIAVSN